MAVSKNFLPKFDIQEDLANCMRNIERAKSLTTGWYKGQFDYHLRKAGYVVMINGEEYYRPVSGLLYEQANFFNKGTNGWHVAEWLKLIGLQDADLRDIQKTANTKDVDGIYHSWKAKVGISTTEFKRDINNLKKQLVNIDKIEIDYENERYKSSVYTTESSRIYNTKESLYGDSLRWGQPQKPFDITNWTYDGRTFYFGDIDKKATEFAYGNTIRFYKDGIDVSSQYADTLKNAVKKMIAYSGNEFMQRLSSSKTGETTYIVNKYSTSAIVETETYISAIGTEVFNPSIKQAFLDDEEDRHFIRYTVLSRTSGGKGQSTTYSMSKDILEGRSALRNTTISSFVSGVSYTNDFWDYVGYVNSTTLPIGLGIIFQTIVNKGDEHLFYDTRNSDVGAYLKVSEFRKLSIEDIGYVLGEYFDIRVTQDDGGWFSGFIGAIAGLLGLIHNFVFDILYSIPAVKIQIQANTRLVNKIFNSNLTDKELYDMTNIIVINVIGIFFSWISLGWSVLLATAISLGIAGGKAIDKEKEAERTAEEEKTRKKQLEKDNKKKAEQEQMKQKLNMESEMNEREEFQMFLKNPMYKLDREKRQLESDFKSQFKLL